LSVRERPEWGGTKGSNEVRRITKRISTTGAVVAAIVVLAATAALAAWLWTVSVGGSVTSADAAVIEFATIYTGEVSASEGSTTPVVNADGSLTITVDGFTSGAVATGAARFWNASTTTPGDVLAFGVDGADVEVVPFGTTPVGDRALILEYGFYGHNTPELCGVINYDTPVTLIAAQEDGSGDPIMNTDNSRCLKWAVTMTDNAAPGTVYDLGIGGLDISSS